MNLLFWILWFLDLCMGIFLAIAKGFRSSFTASDPTLWFTILVILALVGGLLLRLMSKETSWALALVSLPWLVLLAWYLLD
jgi:hypothetical protein